VIWLSNSAGVHLQPPSLIVLYGFQSWELDSLKELISSDRNISSEHRIFDLCLLHIMKDLCMITLIFSCIIVIVTISVLSIAA